MRGKRTDNGVKVFDPEPVEESQTSSCHGKRARGRQDFIVPQSGQTLEVLLLSRDRSDRRGEFLLKAADGEEIPVLLSARPLLEDDVEVFCIVATDLTEQKRVQRELEDANTTLRVLLKRWEEDRKEVEERLVLNVKQLVLPHVKKLKDARLEPSLHRTVDLIEANLEEILSPFLNNLRPFNLTSRQLEIIALIKDGRTTKDIAEALHVSKEAIDKQRFLIRKKLDLNKDKASLRLYLLSLA